MQTHTEHSHSMQILTAPDVGQLFLLIANRTFLRQTVPLLIARLTHNSHLRILDGSNSFNFHETARELRRQTVRLQERLESIHIARAFTCYQVVSMLSEMPQDGTFILGLNLLSTFYDENVAEWERDRLINQVLICLQQLSQSTPTLLTAQMRSSNITDKYLPQLEEIASQVWKFENKPSPFTPRLL